MKPRGNGAQTGLTIDGQSKTLKNNTTYTFTASNMTAKVYNNQVAKTTETVRDEFNSVAYNNNDGTHNWTSRLGPRHRRQ